MGSSAGDSSYIRAFLCYSEQKVSNAQLPAGFAKPARADSTAAAKLGLC